MDIIGRYPTIPEYYKIFINEKVDLLSDPKQCCPFHYEKTPSFSYSAEKDVWRCFGACKCGGDVFDLHKKNFKLMSKEEAKKSLKAIFKVYDSDVMQNSVMLISEQEIEQKSLYQKALVYADRPERWAELDQVMSIYPLEDQRLRDLLLKWEVAV